MSPSRHNPDPGPFAVDRLRASFEIAGGRRGGARGLLGLPSIRVPRGPRFLSGQSFKLAFGQKSAVNSGHFACEVRTITTEATVPVAVASSSEVFSLQVVANGNASDPVPFDALAVWVDFNYLGSLQLGSYSNPYKTLSNGVSALSKGGTIAFKANVQPSVSHETMTISKPMTLISVGGSATVGQK
jgi:hypothetical protein